jgi:hypothetical protein
MLRTGDHSIPPDLEYAEVFGFGEATAGKEHLIPDWARTFFPPKEYEGYAKVYILNESAYRMYQEGGINFEVAKIIPEAELPRGCNLSLRGPYIPNDE